MTASPRSDPPRADPWAVGLALLRAGRGTAAEAHYRALLPRPAASLGVARALQLQSRYAEALPLYRAALAGLADPTAAKIDAARVVCLLGNPQEALDMLADLPPTPPVLASRLAPLMRLDRLEALLETARACLRHDLACDEARFAEATALMRLGRLREGWAAFEHGWDRIGDREYAGLPRWDGSQPIQGRRLLVHAEQGLGDTIQFVRYLALLRRRGARVVLRAQPALTRLLAPLADALNPHDQPIAPHDLHVPLMRLPFLLGTTLATIPAGIPYLSPPPGAPARWQARLAGLPGRRIGLAWAGAAYPDQPELAEMDRRRSLPAALAASLAMPGITLISLQKDQAAPPGLVDWTAELDDLADTAALVAGLDMVISVDTAVAHLAGAMGRPVWLLNRFDGCWRWLRGRDDCPWYPTLRQFRQPAPGDWATPLAAIAEALKA